MMRLNWECPCGSPDATSRTWIVPIIREHFCGCRHFCFKIAFISYLWRLATVALLDSGRSGIMLALISYVESVKCRRSGSTEDDWSSLDVTLWLEMTEVPDKAWRLLSDTEKSGSTVEVSEALLFPNAIDTSTSGGKVQSTFLGAHPHTCPAYCSQYSEQCM